ncbi:hypothetical protein [Zunongwangia profunda]|uniref:Apea-like HEPN domain-containing protein n=1 Tax=Zunongwangia profunda (strain DSM 18752 / CCTCC AB 206139 / SM-A87) TaxID=655815 RepID=D5BMB2_ZUNPS|nr:hypothetical protein [Zunongwangia profunda]ADF54252.1 conserved hypothetical protein [Zunongwangia profunda SM-A87]MAS70743.1 hypothetical protein [Zunongwangia sp.]|tara:strand:+ start:518 stop:2278 length:1761 start_codon:yes stop_codon:yes gene_type:complete
MQKLNFNYQPNDLQRIFVEKGLELLYKDTIDSYRLRLHNPKSIIEELVNNCISARNGHLTNNEYTINTASETRKILEKKEDALNFQTISREYYLELLKSVKKQHYNVVIQASNLILKENRNYQELLIQKLEEYFQNYDPEKDLFESDIKHFLLIVHYLIIEYINLGYTKQYLYHYFRTIFVYTGDNLLTFNNRFEIWKNLCIKEKEKFTVIVEILGESFQHKTLQSINSNYTPVNARFRNLIPESTSEKVRNYLEEKKNSNLIALELKALDHFKSIELARSIIASDLDIYHLGYNNQLFRIDDNGAIIGSIQPEKASTVPINYQLDGYIRSSKKVFNKSLEKIKLLKINNVSEESIDKIISAVRYLRTGSESPELETKLLNYWIGLEYIFTLFNSQEKTIDVMRRYLPTCHGVIYIKRNLYDFHKALKRIGISHQIEEYNDNMQYLTKFRTYDEIKGASTNQLIKFRSSFYQKLVSDPSNINRSLEKHQENLIWNITRLYKIRNEIVHNAAVTDNISVNVSHLKYYLTFILNSLMDFMSNSPIDIDGDQKITIEDYFISQTIIFGALKGQKVNEYLKVNNPMESLS